MFDRCLTGLCTAGLVVARFEPFLGEPDPLRGLRAQLPLGHEALDHFSELLGEFSSAGHDRRVTALPDQLGVRGIHRHERQRARGRHYADRGVFFEECHAPIAGLTAGRELHDFVAAELAPIYDIVLVGPRLRMRREQALLANWVEATFGGRAVPLAEFYRHFLADRQEIAARCAEVDAEIARVDDDMVATMLAGTPVSEHEVVVRREEIESLLSGTPGPRLRCAIPT